MHKSKKGKIVKQEYKSIRVKSEVIDSLKDVVEMLNKKQHKSLKKITIAGLVSRLAESYNRHTNEETIVSNTESWILDGVPVILDSDAAKHFAELVAYDPILYPKYISNEIRRIAMDKRYENIMTGDNK